MCVSADASLASSVAKSSPGSRRSSYRIAGRLISSTHLSEFCGLADAATTSSTKFTRHCLKAAGFGQFPARIRSASLNLAATAASANDPGEPIGARSVGVSLFGLAP